MSTDTNIINEKTSNQYLNLFYFISYYEEKTN